jgi:hypothetical protein
MWSTVFGKASVKVLSFEGVLALDNARIATTSTSRALDQPSLAFLTELGINVSQHDFSEALGGKNKSPSSEVIDIFMQLQQIGIASGRTMVERSFLEHYAEIER